MRKCYAGKVQLPVAKNLLIYPDTQDGNTTKVVLRASFPPFSFIESITLKLVKQLIPPSS